MTRHSMFRIALTSASLFALCFSSTASPQVQKSDSRLESVFAAWDKRHQRFKSVGYVAEGHTTLFKHSQEGDRSGSAYPPDNVKMPIRYRLLLEFATNRHRLEEEQPSYHVPTGEILINSTIMMFDGKVLKSWGRRQSPKGQTPPPTPDVGVSTGDYTMAAFDYQYDPFFLGHGMPHVMSERIIPGRLKPVYDRDTFYVHGEGVCQGRSCMVLRTPPLQKVRGPVDEFWVDMGRDGAVLRHVRFNSDGPLLDHLIQYERKSDAWLPAGWTSTHYHPGTRKATLSREVKVVSVVVEPLLSDQDFDIAIVPGMLVVKSTLPPSRSSSQPVDIPQTYYRVSDHGQWNEVEILDGKEVAVWSWSMKALIALLVTGCVVVIVWLAHRRYPRLFSLARR